MALDLIEKITINGSEQWISVRANSTSLPVILFLHGGPGTAQIPFARKLQSGLELIFTVVNWDQRGSGRSFHSKMRHSKLTLGQILDDTEALVDYLLERFGQSKVVLVGHSWGTILGFEMSKRIPEKISAYIGIAQVINMVQGEARSYSYTLAEARARNITKAISQLEKIGPPPYKRVSDGGIQRDWLGRLGGITFDNSGILLLLKYLSLRDCGLVNLFRFIGGIMYSLTQLEEEQMKVDYTSDTWNSSVPCYLVCGRKDYNVPFELAEQWGQKNQGNNVELVWFDRSGHLPNYEEREKFIEFCNGIAKKFAGTANQKTSSSRLR